MSVQKSRKNEILRYLIKIKLFRSLYFNLTNNFYSKYIFTDTLYYLKTPPHQPVTDTYKIVEFNEFLSY
jgi:hypothetical protein